MTWIIAPAGRKREIGGIRYPGTIMGMKIDIDANPRRLVEIDGEAVARELGLEVAKFRQSMEHGGIAVLCERGTAEHAGLFRVSFFHGRKRARFVVDGNGDHVQGVE